MQSLSEKTEQLGSSPANPHPEIKTLKEKIELLKREPTTFIELRGNQSALIFTETEEGISLEMAEKSENAEPSITDFICAALYNFLEKEPEFVNDLLEHFDPDIEE